MVDYLAEIAIDVVDTRLGNEPIAQVATPSKSRSRRVSGFKLFVWNFIRNASVGMPVLLVTLVYLTRARDHLRIEADDRGYERVFLGAFIVASKVCPSNLEDHQYPNLVIRSTPTIPHFGAFAGFSLVFFLASKLPSVSET